MNADWTPSDELVDLLEAVCTDQITAEQTAQLESLVLTEPMARRYYVRYLHLHASLPQILSSYEDINFDSLADTSEATDLDLADESASPASTSPIAIATDFAASPNDFTPSYGLPGKLWHGTVGFFSQELPFSLLIATVVTGLGLLLGSLIFVNHHQYQVSANASRPALPAVKTDMEFVGRITGMVDVQWSDKQTVTVHGAHVPLGRKYALASGFMEITYDTGARVVLQGPVTYEVDSRDGGFLSLGKLTARLETKRSAVSDQPSAKVASKERSEVRGQGSEQVASKERSEVRGQGSEQVASEERSEVRGQGSEQVASESDPKFQNPKIPKSPIPNPSSPAPRPQSPASIFAVRTPTATVTDLGTEFGVEVDRHGGTISYVFQGTIKVRPEILGTGKYSGEYLLVANESISIEQAAAENAASAPTIRHGTANPQQFVRIEQYPQLAVEKPKQIAFDNWRLFSEELRKRDDLLAYYDFQPEPDRRSTLPNRAPTGSRFDGQLLGGQWVSGRFAGKHALKFKSQGDGVRIHIPVECKNMTLVASVNAENLSQPLTALVMSDNFGLPGHIHWLVEQNGRAAVGIIGWIENIRSWEVFYDYLWDRWNVLAVVCDSTRGKVVFYLNGRNVGESPIPTAGMAKLDKALIGAWKSDDHRTFRGRMDELMIFKAALSDKEIRRFYKSGQYPEGR